MFSAFTWNSSTMDYQCAMRNLVLAALAFVAACGPAAAADVIVSVRTPAGQPVANAVVTVHIAGVRSGPIRFSWPQVMAQQNIQFHPFVLIAPVGGDVSFPNRDSVRHHVYSFSAAKKFELKLYGQDQTRSVHFDKPGVVALGCNIHDTMVGFIDVVDTPYAALTDAAGNATIHGTPAGSATLTVWQPYLRAPRGEISRAIALPAGGVVRTAIAVDIRPPAPMKMSH
jgi:plastocyanin